MKSELEKSVCRICGTPWEPGVKNVCEVCGGFCTWGVSKGAEPDSWDKVKDGYIPRKPNIKEKII